MIDRCRHFNLATAISGISYTLRDEMLGDEGVGIDERSPDVGGPWESIAGGLLCNGSGEAFSNSGAPFVTMMTSPGLANGFFTATIRQNSATPSTLFWILFNLQDEDNYWAFGAYGGNARLTKVVGGSETEVWTAVESWGLGSHVIKVQRNDDTIICYIDGVEVTSEVDATLKENTICGIATKRSGDGQYCLVDRVTVAVTDA